MNRSRLFRVEMHRLLRQRRFQIIVLLCLLMPFVSLYIPLMNTGILSNKYIAQPVMLTSAFGGIFWAILTMLEASRAHRSGTDVITDALSAPALLPAARMAAQIVLSAVTTIAAMLLYMPFAAMRMQFLFSAPFYILNYVLLVMPSWWISMLLAESFYQFTRRLEAAAALYAVAVAYCMLPPVMTSQSLRWICPIIITYSDAFPTYWPIRIGVYSRVIWLLLTLALYLLSLASVRKYARGFFASFLLGCRKVVFPLGAACLTAAAVLMGYFQPFVDHGPRAYDFDDTYSDGSDEEPERPVLSAVNCRYWIAPHSLTGTVSGTAEYDIKNNSGYKIEKNEYSFILNCGYRIDTMTLDGQNIPFETSKTDDYGWRRTTFTLPEPCVGKLMIYYHGMPTQTRAAMPYCVYDTVDKDSLALYGNSFAPMLEDINVTNYGTELCITLPEDQTPFLDFIPMPDKVDNGDGTCTWSTKNSVEEAYCLVAGKYTADCIEAAGVQINFVYGSIYRDTVHENNLADAVRTVFEYCTEHYGTSAHANGNALSLIQTSALILGGWASDNWSTWMEETVTPEALTDNDKGASAMEVFMHEIIHQWWGGLGVDCGYENLWSDEGITVYATYRLTKELYGEEYAKKYYVGHWMEAVRDQNRNFYNRHPEMLKHLPQFMQDRLNEENRNTNQYCRMPLMLLKAEQLLGGEEAMDALLHSIYDNWIGYCNSPDYEYGDYYSFEDFLQDSGLTEEDLNVDEDFLL